MAKKQISNYKFVPGAIPPAYGQYPNTADLLIANKDYIIAETMGYLTFKSGTPASAPTAYPNAIALLTANKNFIKEEAAAWLANQVANNVAPFVNYTYNAAKCKRDVGYLVDAWIVDLTGGGNSETIRIGRMYYLNGDLQLLNPTQESAVYTFVKMLIGSYVLTRTAYSTMQSPVVSSQSTAGSTGEAGAITRMNTLLDIIISLIPNGVASLPAIVYNYDVLYVGYTYNSSKCSRDTQYVIESYIYDLVYGGNSSTYYTASRYYVNGVIQVNNYQVEVTTQTFVRNLINNYILTKTYHASYQWTVEQSVLGNNAEAAGVTAVTTLANYVINTINLGLGQLPTPRVPDSQNGGLLTNAVALLESNKRFIIEETIAYIQYNVNNNISPYVYFSYNSDKCKRDISYVVEGYISDLKHGGNRQTVFNAGKYWDKGVPQVDGDRQPEIYAHTFIRDLIENYIWANIVFTTRQATISQVVDNGNVPEGYSITRIKELSNTIIDVITNGPTYLPAVLSNRGYIKMPGYFKIKDFLLITNSTRNQIIYNFADDTVAGEVTYTEEYDADFPAALYGNEAITTITLDYDTTGMMITDGIQIFVEAKYQEVRMNEAGRDAMERMRVGIPQSMLDADFEYGLQPTKWQAISLLRNYPSIYEIPGSDIAVTNVTTDASTGTGGFGSSLITVTTLSAHGLSVGSPITIKALANSISGFGRAEGAFLVAGVTDTVTFTYYAKSKVGTSNGQVLSSTYTQLRKGGFYTGAGVGSPSFNLFSAGSSGTITTSLVTTTGADFIGFTGTAPPVGSPLTGTGIASGTQVTAVTGNGGVAATTKLTTFANIGATAVVVNSTTGISPGLVFNRGDGAAVLVTDVTGNTVSLSGALTATINGTIESYTTLSQNATSGGGLGGIFTVSRNAGTYSVTATNPGGGYTANDTVTINGANLGGSTSTNNATITITAAADKKTVATLNNSTGIGGSGYSNGTGIATTVSPSGGTGLTIDITTSGGVVNSFAVNAPGKNYNVGDTVTITNTQGKVLTSNGLAAGTGYTSANAVATTVTKSSVATITFSPSGTGYSTATGVATTGGAGTGLTVNITDNGSGGIATVAINNRGSGYLVSDTITITGGNADATFTVATLQASAGVGLTVDIVDNGSGGIATVTINNPGSGYAVNDVITIGGGSNGGFTVSTVSTPSTIQVLTVNAGGEIQTVSVAGTPITAPDRTFISAITLNAGTTSTIATGNTGITYSAIPIIEVTFASAHGFIPGDSITVQISSSGTGAQLAAGAYYVEQAPTVTTLRYTARAAGTIANTLTGTVYARPDSYFVHRPFDGGVQLGTGGPAHGATAIRMSKKYIRYQSGKGVMYNTGALFAPSYDIRSLSATGTAVGSVVTVATDDTDHGCQVGAQVVISGAATTGYNGVYTVSDIVDERTFSFIANKTLGSTTAILGSPCQMSVKNWHGATVRAGIFDDQNGMFWQYDGIRMAVGRRSSTFQIAGTISINANSNAVTGSNTRFTQQLAAGDRVVIRGMSHVITTISNDTTMTVSPDYRGVTNVSNVKVCKTIDILIPQENWNLDPLNGSGPSGYNLDPTKMQMIGLQHTWYGAGFIDFMLRGSDGNYCWAHRFRNSNVNTEAYMRTGNQPVRYEVINEGATARLSSEIDAVQTSIPLDTTFWFPTSGTVIIDNELIRFTGNTGTALTGCTRGASMSQYVAGAQRTFSGGVATTHLSSAGVILVSNTVTPIISHWGSAFMIDGQFDNDRGYIFSYAATGISVSVDKTTAFLMRLAPSVSNAITGDLGEKELLNRAQLLLSGIACVSDSVAGGGAIVIEGVLNPSNYPTDPTLITWNGLSSQAAGGQPSFTQIASGGSVTWGGGASTATATVQGAFSTTLTAKSFAAATQSLTATSFNAVTQTLNTIAITAVQNAIYQFAFDSTRTDILITQTAFAALTTSVRAGDTLTMPGGGVLTSVTIAGTGGQFTCAVATLYVGMTVTISGTFGGTGSITGYVNPTTYRISATNGTTTFTLTTLAGAAITTTAGTPTGLTYTATNFITGGRTVVSATASYITINSVVYARIVLNSAPNLTSATNTAVTNLSLNSSAAATYNTALSTARTDFLIPQTQFASATLATTDVLSTLTFIVGGQTISSLTANFTTIGGTAYARIVMSAAASATSTAGSGNNVTVTSTSAATATYGSALSTARTDFLITDAAYAGSGIAIGDTLSLTTAATLSTVVITGSAGQFSCASTYLAVGMTVTISGTLGGTGSITGYATPTTYKISVTNGSTTFTLTTTADVAIVTGAGTPTGLTYTVGNFISGGQTISSITQSYITISSVVYTRIVMSAAANVSSAAGASNDITTTVTASGSAASYVRTSYLFFTSGSWSASGATIGTRVASDATAFPAGTSVNAISTRTFGGSTVYRVSLTQASNTTIAAAATLKFQFGANYALPGEQVFSFITNPGSTDSLSLESLKELTATALGGRGAFPNGPDVLAINVYKVSGTATPSNIILRWGEAQA